MIQGDQMSDLYSMQVILYAILGLQVLANYSQQHPSLSIRLILNKVAKELQASWD